MQIRRGDHKMRRETNVHERCLSIYASYLGYRDTVKDIRIPWTHNSRNSSSIDISYAIDRRSTSTLQFLATSRFSNYEYYCQCHLTAIEDDV